LREGGSWSGSIGSRDDESDAQETDRRKKRDFSGERRKCANKEMQAEKVRQDFSKGNPN